MLFRQRLLDYTLSFSSAQYKHYQHRMRLGIALTVLIWFESTRAAKIIAIILGASTLISLVVGGIHWIIDFNMQQSHQQVTAVVTDNFISQERRGSWSDAQFELDGQIHTVRHNHFWRIGREVELLVDARNPQQTYLVDTIGLSVRTAMTLAGVFGFVFLFYLFNFLSNRRRDRKQMNFDQWRGLPG